MKSSCSQARSATRLRSGPRPLPRSALRCDSFPASARYARYLADASYWLYLIHLPILMALQVAVSQLDWPGLVKFAVIMLVALPVMFASYQLLVRYSFIGAVLNGRRMRPEAQPTPPAPQFGGDLNRRDIRHTALIGVRSRGKAIRSAPDS